MVLYRILELIIVILILAIAAFATRWASNKVLINDFYKRGQHQQRKIRDLGRDIDALYRADLTGVLRNEIGELTVDGFFVRYNDLIREMVKNGTIFVSENTENIPKLKKTLLNLQEKMEIQQKLNGLIGDDIFPDDPSVLLQMPDLQFVHAEKHLLEEIKHDFEYYEKHFHPIHAFEENASKERAEEVYEATAGLSGHFTYFYDDDKFFIVKSTDWGEFVQNVLDELEKHVLN
jgi:hypothetical protein